MPETEFLPLQEFYSSLKCGLAVSEFQSKYCKLIEEIPRSFNKQFRTREGQFNRLQIEVRPMMYFASTVLMQTDIIRFSLNSDSDDCIVDRGGKLLFAVQVTLSQAREQFALMNEANKGKIVAGFIGLRDSASSAEYKRKLERNRISHTRGEQSSSFCRGVGDAIERKKNVVGGDVLVIDAPRYAMPEEHVLEMLNRLSCVASGSPFKSVVLVREFPSKSYRCYPLKGESRLSKPPSFSAAS